MSKSNMTEIEQGIGSEVARGAEETGKGNKRDACASFRMLGKRREAGNGRSAQAAGTAVDGFGRLRRVRARKAPEEPRRRVFRPERSSARERARNYAVA